MTIRLGENFGEIDGDGPRSYLTFHGTAVHGRGVFLTEGPYAHRLRFAGQCRDRHACGLGVLTWSNGTKEYAELGSDGYCNGRLLNRSRTRSTKYCMYDERGNLKDDAFVFRDGRSFEYNGEACAPDDPRLLALIAQVAPVEVRPATAAPSPVLATLSRRCNRGFAGSFCPPQALATAVASEVHTHTARCRCAQLCSFDILLGLAGRGSRGQPATAIGGARAPAATQYGGMSRGLLKDATNGLSLALTAYSRGPLPRDSAQRGLRRHHPPHARVRSSFSNDPVCRCRDWSCSRRCCLRGTVRRSRRSLPVCPSRRS